MDLENTISYWGNEMNSIKALNYLIIFITIFNCYDCGNFMDGAWDSAGNPVNPYVYNGPPPQLYKLKVIRNYIFLGTSVGIFRTTDNGLYWSFLNNGINLKDSIYLEEVTNDGKVFAFQSDNNTISSAKSLFVSKNFGDTWTQQSYLDESEYHLQDGSIYAKDENNIFISCSLNKIPDETAVKQGIIRSTDGGNSWQIVYQRDCTYSYVSTFPIVFQSNGDIYALTSIILKSTDNGLTWDSVGTAGENSNPIHGEINPANQIYLLYGDNDMLVSNDFGRTWKVLKKGITSFSICSNSEIFVNKLDGGILKSTDYGVTWENTAWENIDNSFYKNLYVDGKDEIFHYSIYFIYESKDYGTSWQKIEVPFDYPSYY